MTETNVIDGQVEHSVCECGSNEFARDYARGEITCIHCGLVREDRIPENYSRRAFNAEERKNRTRAEGQVSNLLPNMGIYSSIQKKNNNLSGKKQQKFRRLRQIDNSVKSDRFTVIVSEIRTMTSKLGLSLNIAEAIATIVRKARKKSILKGRSIGSVVAASTYIVARTFEIPLTLKKVVEISPATSKQVSKAYSKILIELKIKLPTLKPKTLIAKIVNSLKLPQEVETSSLEIARDIKGSFNGKDPCGIAGAIVYISSILADKKVSQKLAADASGVTEVTLRNRAKEIKKFLNMS